MRDGTNEHIQIARLQNQVKEHLGLSDPEAIFEYDSVDGGVTLNLITINSEHNQSFLFHTTRGLDKVSALNAMVDYVSSYREKENSYTLQWAIRGTSRLETSYFRGKDIYQILDKFYFGRDRTTILIYSISLNPIT